MPSGVYDREPNSQEYRDRQRKIALEKGYGKWMTGKKQSLETREKKRKAMTSPENIDKARKNAIMAIISMRSRLEKNEPTDIERMTKEILDEIGQKYIPQRILDITIPDYFIDPNKVIYVDGDYWHDKPEVKRRDEIITKYLLKGGYEVLRIRGSEFVDRKKVKAKIVEFLKT